MSKYIKNLLLKNNININYFINNSYLKDKIKLNKIIKNIYSTLNNKKDTFHILSKKCDISFNKSDLEKFNKYKSVLVIGMGGSSLGTQAIYSFFKHKINKDFFFFDNLDQLKIEQIKKKLDLKNSLFIIISKSGNTIETLINSNLFKDKISFKNTIVITEKKVNLLNSFAKKKKFYI